MNARLRARLAKRRATDARMTVQRVAAFGIAESIAHTTPRSAPRHRSKPTLVDRVICALGWAVAAGLLMASLAYGIRPA